MKVFIGWSGETSHQVALALRDWLPKVIQAVKPYVSSEDIAKGARWSSTIGGELQSSFFGIICVTKENSQSPWINFEAGALSREMEKSLVSPFLFDLKPSDIQGPLNQFQAALAEETEIEKLLSSINERQAPEVRLGKVDLKSAFEMWWPVLKKRLEEVERDQAHRPAPPRRETQEIVEELLNTVRTQRTDIERILAIVAERLEISNQDQVNRLAQLTGLIGAVASNVESLHTELKAPERHLSAFYGGSLAPGTSGITTLRDLLGGASSPPAKAIPTKLSDVPAPPRNLVSDPPKEQVRNKRKL